MEEKELEELATKVVAKWLDHEQREHPRCQCPAGNERHYNHHQFLDKALAFLDRIEEMKWGVAKSVLVVVCLAACGIFAVGLVMKIKSWPLPTFTP